MRREANSKKPPPRKGGADFPIKIKMKIKENQERKSLSKKVYYAFLQKAF